MPGGQSRGPAGSAETPRGAGPSAQSWVSLPSRSCPGLPGATLQPPLDSLAPNGPYSWDLRARPHATARRPKGAVSLPLRTRTSEAPGRCCWLNGWELPALSSALLSPQSDRGPATAPAARPLLPLPRPRGQRWPHPLPRLPVSVAACE